MYENFKQQLFTSVLIVNLPSISVVAPVLSDSMFTKANGCFVSLLITMPFTVICWATI